MKIIIFEKFNTSVKILEEIKSEVWIGIINQPTKKCSLESKRDLNVFRVRKLSLDYKLSCEV